MRGLGKGLEVTSFGRDIVALLDQAKEEMGRVDYAALLDDLHLELLDRLDDVEDVA